LWEEELDKRSLCDFTGLQITSLLFPYLRELVLCSQDYSAGYTRAASSPPCSKDEIDHVVDTLVLLDACKYGRTVSAHDPCVTLHNLQGSIHVFCDIDLVYH